VIQNGKQNKWWKMSNQDEATTQTQKVAALEYAGVSFRNREIFLLNYAPDFRHFDLLINELQNIWLRIARERDAKGASHVGLLLPSGILIRHCMVGFQQLVSYQSFLAWLAFRPGLEALLVAGKWVDEPNTARIWREREADRALYIKTFSGEGLTSASLQRSSDFRRVLTRINDQFVHPNPNFAYRESRLREASAETLVLETSFFDREAELHEAHLLAFLNLLNEILTSCDRLVEQICGSPRNSDLRTVNWSVSEYRARAKRLAESSPIAKSIMEELGLWRF
jgi:hypothetical protein